MDVKDYELDESPFEIPDYSEESKGVLEQKKTEEPIEQENKRKRKSDKPVNLERKPSSDVFTFRTSFPVGFSKCLWGCAVILGTSRTKAIVKILTEYYEAHKNEL